MESINNKNVLVFDLETTGLPARKNGFRIGRDEYWDYRDNSKYANSRIVSIAWSYIEKMDINKINPKNVLEYIRKPIDFDKIDEISVNIHGISYELACSKGIILENIFKKGLDEAIMKSDVVIGHNCLFDIHILLNECWRLKLNNCVVKLLSILDNNNYRCTGEIGRNICKIPTKNMRYYKMPTLGELYKYLLNKDFLNAHSAKSDVMAVLEIMPKLMDNDKQNEIDNNADLERELMALFSN